MKYFNKKVRMGDMVFDSKKELNRYNELLLLEINKEIQELIRQPRFVLIETFKDNQGKTERGCHYTPDFSYRMNEKQYVEEIKSSYTAKLTDYPLRRKMFKLKYPDIIFIEKLY